MVSKPGHESMRLKRMLNPIKRGEVGWLLALDLISTRNEN